jgi:hypothetical protein
MQHRLRHSGGVGSSNTTTNLWNTFWYTLKSGVIWYRREINSAGGYFALDYSNNSGVTWDRLFELDLTEESVVIDLTHQYVHTIVGTEYHVSTTLGDLLYST